MPPRPASRSVGTRSEEADTAVSAALAAVRANVSLCEAWRGDIEAGLEKGLNAKRIHQDLAREPRFDGGYQSVKRFVRKLEWEAPVPSRSMEFAPSAQMQGDFRTGAEIFGDDGKKLRSHVLRAVVSCSRKG